MMRSEGGAALRKAILSVAAVSPSDTRIDPHAIAKDVIQCWKHGAAMVHMHARDRNGNLTPDLSVLKETVDDIRRESDIIVEISTGGVSNLTIEERCRPCFAPYVEETSLNVGSVNLGEAVYQNPIKDVEYCVKTILENRKHPDAEMFEMGMIQTLKELDEQFHLPRPRVISLVHGYKGAVPATSSAVNRMLETVEEAFPDEDFIWGFIQGNRQDWTLVQTALDMGATIIRVGMEDSKYLAPGIPARANLELVQRAADLIKGKGIALMTPSEAREAMHLSQPAR